MPTIFSHVAVPLAIGLGLGAARVPPRLIAAGMLASIVPDFDVIAFKLGIPYADAFGHRGASHSMVFAALLGAMASAFARTLASTRLAVFGFVFVSALSHGLLDMLTNGGLGVALFWPMVADRIFFPAQVISVSPIGVTRFFTESGWRAVRSELGWIWLPALASCAVLRIATWNARTLRAPPH